MKDYLGKDRIEGALIELCFKSDTALRYLRSANERINDGYLQGFIDEMQRKVDSSREALAAVTED